MKKQKLLSLCMIVKDEIEFIEGCINSVKGIANEIIIADTGSTDGTPEKAEALGAKVYRFEWVQDFSRARNFAIGKATGKWLLLIDADERLFAEDAKKLLDFLTKRDYDGAHFKVYNYVGEKADGNYTLHNALRLLRNDGTYRFSGGIHEQIERVDGKPAGPRFALTDIRLHHYGYLDPVAERKNKRARNIPILLSELEKKPDDAFNLFNIGNEYMALKNYAKACECYEKSLKYADRKEAFCPHLYFRAALCLQKIFQPQKAVGLLKEGLAVYPGCTDMELCRGLIYSDLRLDLLAVKSFKRAMEMGEPHSSLRFTDGCASTRPLLASAEVYLRQRDYSSAEDACKSALVHDSKLYAALYKIAEVCRARGDAEDKAASVLESFFVDTAHPPNLILLADIMLSRRYLKNAEKYISAIKAAGQYAADHALLSGRLQFMKREFEASRNTLLKALGGGKSPEVLPGLTQSGVSALAALGLISCFKGESYEDVSCALKTLLSENQEIVLSKAFSVVKGDKEKPIENVPAQAALEFLSVLQRQLLHCREFELFEKLLYVYNCIESKKVLLNLAEIYSECGYPGLAASAVISSLKEFGAIDAQGARILLDSTSAGI